MLTFTLFIKTNIKVKINNICNQFLFNIKYKNNFKYFSNISNFEETLKNDKTINIKNMNSSVLCIFSNMLLKENIKNDILWRKIEKRSYELLDKFEIGEVASFLFCLSKIRYETNLYDSFISIIKKKKDYLNSSQIAMLISAYSKRKKNDIITLLIKEFKKNIYMINNITEISMILNAVIRCKIYDQELFEKLCNVIIDQIFYNTIHVRDVCVIAYCYSYINYKNLKIFKILSEKIIHLMDIVNLADLCRIFYSYMNIQKNYNNILKISTHQLKTIINKCTIDNVINCIHFLPKLKEIVQKENQLNIFEDLNDYEINYTINFPYLFKYIVHIFNEKIISYVNILDSNQISNILYIYSRYYIEISASKLEKFINKIKNMELSHELKVYVLYSFSLIIKNIEYNISDNNNNFDKDKDYENKNDIKIKKEYKENFNYLDINKIFIKKNEEEITHIKNKKTKNDYFIYFSEKDNDKIKNHLLNCLKDWSYDINLFINNYTICSMQDIIKILNIFFILNYVPNSIINSIKHYIIFNYKHINEYIANLLLFYFQKLKLLTEEEDFIESLKIKIKIK